MIDDLKAIVTLINSLPQLALWVSIGFWIYKVTIIGVAASLTWLRR